MQESYWGYWLVLMGLFVTGTMLLLQGVSTTNTQDYYQLKEITDASIVDSIDFGYYRVYGEVKINKEKFVENFIRRFAETATLSKSYQLDFYDLYEAPPKVSVKVTSLNASFNVTGDEGSLDIVNKLDAIVEVRGQDGNDVVCDYYS